MKLLDQRAARVLFTAILFGLGLMFVYAARRTIIAFIFAIFFAYLLEAPVARVERWLRNSRGLAIAAVYLVALGIIALVLALAAPRIAQETQRLVAALPSLTEKISSGQIAYQVGGSRGWSAETQHKVESFLASHRQQIVVAAQRTVAQVVDTAKNLWWLVLVPILSVFFLKDGRKFGAALIESVPGEQDRRVAASTLDEMNAMLGHFIRAQLIIALLAMLAITLVTWAMGVPYAFVIGPAAGALEFIPVVGPVLGGALVMGVAFMANYQHLLWLLIFLLAWRGTQDYVNGPRIMGRRLALHPLAILFGVLAGGEVAGVVGVFLSIPILATLRILWHTWRSYRSARMLEPAPTPQTVETLAG